MTATATEWRLMDARRWLDRHPWWAMPDEIQAWMEQHGGSRWDAGRRLDQEISERGPRAPLLNEKPSGTGAKSGQDGREQSRATGSSTETGEGQGPSSTEIHGAKPRKGRGDRPAEMPAPADDQTPRDTPSPMEAATARRGSTEEVGTPQRHGRDAEGAVTLRSSPSATPRPVWGGVTASAFDEAIREADPKATRETVRLLRRLLSETMPGAHGDPSPRINSKRLVTELISRRCALSRARREEMEPAIIVLLCDVSGSCSATSAETLAACQEIARRDPAVEVVVHTNGFPLEHFDGRRWSQCSTLDGDAQLYDQILTGRTVAGTVAWGDSDAAWILSVLAEQAPLIWLDSYSARYGVAMRPAPCEVPALACVRGVNSAESGLYALRMARRVTA